MPGWELGGKGWPLAASCVFLEGLQPHVCFSRGAGGSSYVFMETLGQLHVLLCVGGSGLWWLALRLEPQTSRPYHLSSCMT